MTKVTDGLQKAKGWEQIVWFVASALISMGVFKDLDLSADVFSQFYTHMLDLILAIFTAVMGFIQKFKKAKQPEDNATKT